MTEDSDSLPYRANFSVGNPPTVAKIHDTVSIGIFMLSRYVLT